MRGGGQRTAHALPAAPAAARTPRTLLVGLILCTVAGCGEKRPQVSLAPPRQGISHKDYDGIRQRWTRNSRIIKKLDTTLRVHATLFAPEFNAAYAARRAHMFKLAARDRAELSQRLADQWSKSYAFLVSAATVDVAVNDFDRRRSVWRVSLANDRDGQVVADEIRRETTDATLKDLFPYIGRFHSAYTFRFPRTLPDGTPLVDDSTRTLTLRFAGALGQTELVWQLR